MESRRSHVLNSHPGSSADSNAFEPQLHIQVNTLIPHICYCHLEWSIYLFTNLHQSWGSGRGFFGNYQLNQLS